MQKLIAALGVALSIGFAIALAKADSPEHTNPTTCTDPNGVIFHQGEPGFGNCLLQAQKHKQMSGETPSPGPSESPIPSASPAQ